MQQQNRNSEFEGFCYSGERFADIQILRYRLNGFESLSLRQKLYVYYLSKATLAGRDITTDQFGFYNLDIRKVLEAVYVNYQGNKECEDFIAMTIYLMRIWFSNGIYHHYGSEKFAPGFSPAFLLDAMKSIEPSLLPLTEGETVEGLFDRLKFAIFDPSFQPKKVNKADGCDLVATSACNFYHDVSQKEVEDYYSALKATVKKNPPSFGLNSRLVKQNGELIEQVWKIDGMYGKAIETIVSYLRQAAEYAENEQQQKIISLLISYYQTGDLRIFDEYSIEWLKEQDGRIDFINGFIEVYNDPLGLKASWEGIVEYKDLVATRRTRTISDNAQWFEDNSPVDPRFKKKTVKGVTANVVCAAMLGGDEYPSTAIGINLPNADWIRAEHGSKSVTIGNLTDAYKKAARVNGFDKDFVIDEPTRSIIDKYGNLCDDLHTDLHECLGHGSGQLLPGVDPDALKAYSNTIEEARADLFGLYYIADQKLVDLGLVPSPEAYKSQYYTYMMNCLMTQLVRIKPGHQIEEAHMRNRALIARWALDNGDGAVELKKIDGKTYLIVNDYQKLRQAFAHLLAEVQRIKSEGDFLAARELIEAYGVKVDAELHNEILERYKTLNIAPYKGFLNPWLKIIYADNGEVKDVVADYTETYEQQMFRYSHEYGLL